MNRTTIVTGEGTFLALSGGVGGAKLALGLSRVVEAKNLTIIANTGDDFEHMGLPICPDIDTLLYTLSGQANQEQGWGLEGETWHFMSALEKLEGETWFRLGDKDLATHVRRRSLLEGGASLSEVTAALASSFGIDVTIAPMSDSPVRTIIETAEEELPFQDYFVRLQCAPQVTGFRFEGAGTAQPSPTFQKALSDKNLSGIILCPSNPFVSIDPILSIQGVKAALTQSSMPVIAVCPIVGGRAIKGPSAKMMDELNMPKSPLAIADHYKGLIDGLVIDELDVASQSALKEKGLQVHICQTVMRSLEDRIDLARECLEFVRRF